MGILVEPWADDLRNVVLIEWLTVITLGSPPVKRSIDKVALL